MAITYEEIEFPTNNDELEYLEIKFEGWPKKDKRTGWEVDEIQWDDENYSDSQNEIIDSYLNKNLFNISDKLVRVAERDIDDEIPESDRNED